MNKSNRALAQHMKAIIDCNSFYAACERVFKPSLDGKPVVVLSNNDGCIVSRTDEAKALGIKMAGPYYEAKEILKQHDVAVFSSNYHLYGDMSWRVMETLRMLCPHVEVYSVDEAFADMDGIAEADMWDYGLHIRNTVEQWTGLPVSVGIAPTKTLAKVANHIAKKNKVVTQGTIALLTPEQIRYATPHIGASTDLYALGCILFALVANREPYTGTNEELLQQHRNGPVPEPSLAAGGA